MRFNHIPKSQLYITCLTVIMMTLAQNAKAEDRCQDSKQLTKAIDAFFDVDESLNNVIDPVFELSMETSDENTPLSGLLYRYQDQSHEFTLDDTGKVLKLGDVVGKLSPKGELCPLSNGKLIEQSEDDLTINANISFKFPYKNMSGKLTIDELVEGASDGSKLMKKLAPSGLGFVVPKLKAVIVSPRDENKAAPKLIFMKNSQIFDGPDAIIFNNAKYYHLSDLKKSKVDHIIIEGEYNLYTSFDFKDDDIRAAEKRRLERQDSSKDEESSVNPE